MPPRPRLERVRHTQRLVVREECPDDGPAELWVLSLRRTVGHDYGRVARLRRQPALTAAAHVHVETLQGLGHLFHQDEPAALLLLQELEGDVVAATPKASPVRPFVPSTSGRSSPSGAMKKSKAAEDSTPCAA